MRQIIFIVFLCISIIAEAQDIFISTPNEYASVDDVVKNFMKQHDFQFSYDVKRMQKSYILTPNKTLSFNSFKNLIVKNNIKLEEKSAKNYLLIQNDITIAYCAILKEKFTDYKISDVIILQGDRYLATTDLSGLVNLDIIPGTLLTFTNALYLNKTEVALITQEGCNIIFLENKVRELEEIVITNYITHGIAKKKNSSLTLSPKKLGILPGLIEPDIFQSLQLIPGISSPSENPGAIHIRGGTPDQNLILWDGIKIYQNSHFFNQVSSFNPYITKSVDVYRGGASVRYGDRLSGVIDVKSDDDLLNRFKIGAGINLLSADAYLKIPISKKIGLLIAGRRSLTDYYKSFTFNSLSKKVFQNSRLENTEEEEFPEIEDIGLNYFFSDVNAKLIYKPNKYQSYTWSFISIANRLKNKNINTFGAGSLSIEDKLKQTNVGGSFTWRREKKNYTTKQFQFYFSSYSSDYSFVSDTPNEPIVSVNSIRENFVGEIGYDLFYDIPFGKQHHLLLGHQANLSFTNNFSDDIFIDNEGNELFANQTLFFNSGNKSSLISYMEHRYDSKKILLSTGIRFDYNGLLGNIIFEPRVYGTYKVNKSLRLTGSLEQRNQSFSQHNSPQIKFSRIDLLPSVSTFWTDQLFLNQYVIQKSGQLTLGALYDKKGWSLELEGYYKKIDNKIPFDNTFLTAIYSLEDRDRLTTGNAKRFGIDLLIKKRILDYRVWISYSYGNNRVKYDDIQSDYFSEPFDQRHRFNFSQTYKYNQFEFALGFTYASGLPLTSLSSGSIAEIDNLRTNNLFYSNRLPDYNRLDISSVYHFKDVGRWKGKFGVSIRNIYNRKQSLQQTHALILDENNENTIIIPNSRQTLGFTADMVFRVSF